MADEQNPNDNAQPTQPVIAPPAGAPVITPEIEAVIAERVKAATNAVWADARRTYQAKPATTGGTQPKPEPAANGAPAQQADVNAAITRHAAFTRAVRKFDLSDDAYDLVAEEFERSNDPDVTSWVGKRANAYGWKPTGSTSNPASTIAAPAASPAGTPAAGTPPPQQIGSAPPARVVTDDTRILDMTIADRAALTARLGPAKFAQRFKAELKTDTRRFPLRR